MASLTRPGLTVAACGRLQLHCWYDGRLFLARLVTPAEVLEPAGYALALEVLNRWFDGSGDVWLPLRLRCLVLGQLTHYVAVELGGRQPAAIRFRQLTQAISQVWRELDVRSYALPLVSRNTGSVLLAIRRLPSHGGPLPQCFVMPVSR